MANNYLQFSEQLEYENETQRNWLAERFKQEQENDEGPCCQYEDEGPKQNTFWLYAEEYGCPENLANIVSEFQLTFSITIPFTLEWACTCSKMRLNEFSGGGVVVLKGAIQFFNPRNDIDNWLKTQEGINHV